MKREQQALLMKMQLGDIKNGARSRQRHRNVGYELYAGIGEIISKWSKQDMQVAAKSLCLTRSKSFDIFRKNLFQFMQAISLRKNVVAKNYLYGMHV